MTKNTNGHSEAIYIEHDRRKQWILVMTQVPLFTVLMIVAAKLSLLSFPIPVTLQLPVAILSGLILGPGKGTASQILYLAMGLVGLPVFSGGGGLSYVFMPSFGFLLGFPLCAFVAGTVSVVFLRSGIIRKNAYFALFFACIPALIVCYLTGAGYFYLFMNVFATDAGSKLSIMQILSMSVLPFIWKDFLLLFLVAEIARRLYRIRPSVK